MSNRCRVERMKNITIADSKECSKCEVVKSANCFDRDKSKSDGRYSSCKACNKEAQKSYSRDPQNMGRKKQYDVEYRKRPEVRKRKKAKSYLLKERNWSLIRNYGITLAKYNQMLSKQGGVCAICRKPEIKANQYKICCLAVDHDHETGKVRGLLCCRCNLKLGILTDTKFVAKANKYLAGKSGI